MIGLYYHMFLHKIGMYIYNNQNMDLKLEEHLSKNIHYLGGLNILFLLHKA